MAVLPVVHVGVDLLVEGSIEGLDNVVPNHSALGDGIEVLFHRGGEVVVQDVREMLHQIVGHYHSHLLRKQFSVLLAHRFGLGGRGDLTSL